jgi:hypothetical protein
MRTRTQWDFAYNGLTTAQFAAATSQSPAQVREMIGAGWFGLTAEGIPECLDISAPGSKQRTYRIHQSAVNRFYQERAIGHKRKAS